MAPAKRSWPAPLKVQSETGAAGAVLSQSWLPAITIDAAARLPAQVTPAGSGPGVGGGVAVALGLGLGLGLAVDLAGPKEQPARKTAKKTRTPVDRNFRAGLKAVNLYVISSRLVQPASGAEH